MDNEVRSRLVTTFLEVSGIDDYFVRTSLLTGIPNTLSLNRNNSNPHADISLIIDQLARIHSSNGEWGLLIFIDNAKSRVLGTTLSDRLLELRCLLEAGQSPKDVEQSSTSFPQDEEVHEETEKKENQPNDAQNITPQQIQEYRSEVKEIQQLLLRVQSPLKAVYKLFKEGWGIRQDQCEKVILHISNLNAPILRIRELYDKASHPIEAFPIPMYQFRVILNGIADQIDDLSSNLHMFRDSCPISWVVVQVYQSDNEREKIENDRKKIAEQLDSLIKTLEEIYNLLNNFLQGPTT